MCFVHDEPVHSVVLSVHEELEARLKEDQETFEPIGGSHLSVGRAHGEDRMQIESVGEAFSAV